jgi:hypothetical protein
MLARMPRRQVYTSTPEVMRAIQSNSSSVQHVMSEGARLHQVEQTPRPCIASLSHTRNLWFLQDVLGKEGERSIDDPIPPEMLAHALVKASKCFPDAH